MLWMKVNNKLLGTPLYVYLIDFCVQIVVLPDEISFGLLKKGKQHS